MTTTTEKTYRVSLRLHGRDLPLGEWKGDSPEDACVKCWDEFKTIKGMQIEAREVEE